MGQQMEKDGPMQTNYGGYAGDPEYKQPYQGAPYSQAPAGGPYDDAFMDDLSQRMANRAAQSSAGKINTVSYHKGVEPGQRLALGIVSVVMLIPLSAIIFNSINGFGAIVAFGMACLAIFLINGVFNETFK